MKNVLLILSSIAVFCSLQLKDYGYPPQDIELGCIDGIKKLLRYVIRSFAIKDKG